MQASGPTTVPLLSQETEHFHHLKLLMNNKTITLMLISMIFFMPSCRQKQSDKKDRESATVKNDSLPNPIDSEPRKSGRLLQPPESLDGSKGLNSERPTYAGLDKDFIEANRRLHWPRTSEDEIEERQMILKMEDLRRSLLFSIPINSDAEMDRNEAWNTLELHESERGGFLDTSRNEYAKKLLNRYSSAPQIEKLVIWETVRTRLDPKLTGGKRGDATGEILLRVEMARLLFSALGIDKKELFDAIDLKTRAASSEAETKASRAEEEIEKLHIEQSKVAEKILEQHWKLTP
jgi:hypothetical protein